MDTLVTTPSEYEVHVGRHFEQMGYTVRVSPQTGDYGVDVFATRAEERIAIQAKMYGHTSRRINRQTVMELHGAKDYFDCTKAVIATDGQLLPDAQEVATKLGVEVVHISATSSHSSTNPTGGLLTFDVVWERYIIPLRGTTITAESGRSNQIVDVDWGGLTRVSSQGNQSRIDIEIFRLAVNHLLRTGQVTRDHINQNYLRRASSGVLLVLAQVPFFVATQRPAGLTYVPSPPPPSRS
jgi:restriction system protein